MKNKRVVSAILFVFLFFAALFVSILIYGGLNEVTHHRFEDILAPLMVGLALLAAAIGHEIKTTKMNKPIIEAAMREMAAKPFDPEAVLSCDNGDLEKTFLSLISEIYAKTDAFLKETYVEYEKENRAVFRVYLFDLAARLRTISEMYHAGAVLWERYRSLKGLGAVPAEVDIFGSDTLAEIDSISAEVDSRVAGIDRLQPPASKEARMRFNKDFLNMAARLREQLNRIDPYLNALGKQSW